MHFTVPIFITSVNSLFQYGAQFGAGDGFGNRSPKHGLAGDEFGNKSKDM